MDAKAATTLLRNAPERLAAATCALELLTVVLRAPGGRLVATQLYAVQSALLVLERAVRTGTAAVQAAVADALWAHAAGDALDPLERARLRRAAAGLLSAAVHALSVLLIALSLAPAPQEPPPSTGDPETDQAAAAAAAAGRLQLRSRGVVDALLKAHALTVTSYDSFAAGLAGGQAAMATGATANASTAVAMAAGGAGSGTEVLPARMAAAAALGAWIEAGWEPAVLPAAFGLAHSYRKEAAALTAHLGLGVQLMAAGGEDGGERSAAAAATSREPSSASMSPEQGYCLLALLGDLTPREWPPPGHAAGSGFPPPTSQGRRNAFARWVSHGLSSVVLQGPLGRVCCCW